MLLVWESHVVGVEYLENLGVFFSPGAKINFFFFFTMSEMAATQFNKVISN